MSKIFNYIFLIAVTVGGFYYREPIESVWNQAFSDFFPCKRVIAYSLGDFDTRFGISKEVFLGALSDAEEIWEKPLGKDLFRYEEDGYLKVNLIYDTRQETTQTLKNMGVAVENTKDSYNSLKAKYDNVLANYGQDKADFEKRLAVFEARKKVYESEVAAANKKGGASRETYDRLNEEKEYLNQEISALNSLQRSLNNKVEDVNALAKALNQLAVSLNIDVKKYNTVGRTLGGEFEEGTYTSDTSGQRIDVYQFDNRTKLVRVLAHEFGHALGLDHIEDSKAIMYRLNNGVNEKLTAGDLELVKSHCGI